MTPIISPWLIYGLHILTGLQVIAIILVIISMVMWLFLITDSDGFAEDNKRLIKINIYIGVIGVLILLFIPTRNEILTMYALNYLTPDSLQLLGNGLDDFINHILDVVNK